MKRQLLFLVLALACATIFTVGGASAKDKNKKVKTDSTFNNNYNYYQKWLASQTLVVFRDKRIELLQADSARLQNQLLGANVQLSNNIAGNSNLTTANTALQKSLDSLRLVHTSYIRSKMREGGGENDLSLIPVDYDECAKTPKCTDLKDLLLKYPTEEEITSGDADALQKIMDYNDAIKRLDPATVGSYYASLWDQKDIMKHMKVDKENRKTYNHRSYVIDLTLKKLQQRKDFILSKREYWTVTMRTKNLLLICSTSAKAGKWNNNPPAG